LLGDAGSIACGLGVKIMRIVPMARNNAATRWNGGLLWNWWRQIGSALFARLDIHNVDPLRGSRHVLIHYERQAISLVTSHCRHDNFRRRRWLLRACSNRA
jgi:hypothetical protein